VNLLDRVRHLLSEQRVAHAVIGAAALAVHGVSRATLDHDLLVVDQRVLAPAFWGPMGADVGIDIREGDQDDPLAGVVRITLPSDRDVDVVIGRHRWQEEALAQAVLVGAQQLPVVKPADLILLKLYAGGSQDRWDIEQLLALHSPGLVEAVDERIGVLPAQSRALWDALRPGARR
jgi:hypothetical protein